MALESVNYCPICKGNHFTLFNRCIDHTTSGETFSIYQCSTCNFLITSPRPDANSIGKYYQSENYISHTNSSKSVIDKIYKSVRSITLQWKLNLIQKHQKSGTILDYGCGTGEFLNTCKTASWKCFGVEPSAEARQKAEHLTNLKLSQSLSEIASNKFDVITLWHVLEHIEDLNEKLSELKNHLAQDGTIFIAVPNYESLDGKLYQSHWAGYDVPRHLWHFSQTTMGKLLSNHGLKLKEVVPMKQDSFYVSLLSEKYLHPNRNIVLTGLSALLAGLKSNHAARSNQNYSSLVYIATA